MEREGIIASFLDRAPIGVFVIDDAGRTFYANPHAMDLLGRGIVPGAGIGDLAEVYQAYREGTDRLYPNDRLPIVRALAGETVTVGDLEIRRPDGIRMPLEITAFPIKDERGRVTYAMAAFTDITARRVAEARERELTEQLRHAQKMDALGRLAGGIAHDFSNLVTAISGHADLLAASGEVSGEVMPHVESIRAAAGQAKALTARLRDWATPRAGGTPRAVDVCAVVRDIRRMVRPLLPPNVTFESDLPAAPAFVRLGEGQLEQVLVNLLLNARDAMPDGGVVVVGVEHRDGRVRLTVRDSGSGMDAETSRRVFEPFFTTKPDGKGMGLGLTIVHDIAHGVGGSVGVESVPEEGSTITVDLPAVPATVPAPAVTAPVTAGPVSASPAAILVIEDDDALRALVVEVLAKGGFALQSAGSAVEALAAAGRMERLDLILTDSVLPSGGGLGLAARIKESHPAARVVVMSGREPHEPAPGGPPVLPHRFLQKPFRLDVLLSTIREVIGNDR